MWYLAPYTFAYRHAVPALFLAAITVSLALAAFSSLGLVLLTVVLAAYGLLALVASFQQGRRFDSWWMLPILPWLFLAYHLSYGAGINVQGLVQLTLHRTPVQRQREPWAGAGKYRL